MEWYLPQRVLEGSRSSTLKSAFPIDSATYTFGVIIAVITVLNSIGLNSARYSHGQIELNSPLREGHGQLLRRPFRSKAGHCVPASQVPRKKRTRVEMPEMVQQAFKGPSLGSCHFLGV